MKILSDRLLRIKNSAEYSRCTYVDRTIQLHNNAPHRKCLRKKTTACVSLLVFFRTRRGTFPYSIEDDASTISQTPTTHYTNTCVKMTIVTHLSFNYIKSMDQPDKVANPARGQLNKKYEYFSFPVRA